MQDCSKFSALAMELLQSCAKPWIYQLSPVHYKNYSTDLTHIFIKVEMFLIEHINEWWFMNTRPTGMIYCPQMLGNNPR